LLDDLLVGRNLELRIDDEVRRAHAARMRPRSGRIAPASEMTNAAAAI
jgi:hypothetical protein